MTEAVTHARLPLWLRLVLFASLALNLLVAGLAIGLYTTGGPPRAGGGEIGGRLPFVAAMERADRRALSRELRRGPGAGRPARQARRALYEQALSLLEADRFDAEAFGALLEAQRRGSAARAQKGRDLLVAHIAQMSAADRAAYAERLRDVLRRGPRKGGQTR